MKTKKLKTMVTKMAVTAATAVLVAGVFAGCGTAKSAKEETGDAVQKTLKIGVGGSEDAGYVLELAALAKENGYLDEELGNVGYTVEFVPFASAGPEINEALASGAVDAAIYGDFPAFTSKSNGIDSTIIATVNQRMQYGVLAGNDKIKTAKDLEGKKVIYLQGSVQQYFWEKYAEANGIDTSMVEVINSTDTASLLQTGAADAAAGNIYVEKYLENMGVGKIFDDGSSTGVYTTHVVTVKSDILKETPQVAVAINKALIRAYEDAVADKEAFYDAVATKNMPKEIMKSEYAFDESLWYLSPEITEDTRAYYDELNDWLYDHKIIQNKVDVAAFVDGQYYEQAKQELEK